MLQHMHDRYKGWLAWAVIILISITLGAWGIETYTNSSRSTDAVAKVNGIIIHRQQVAAAYDQLREQLQQQLSIDLPLTGALEKQLREEALQTLVANIVLTQATKQKGYLISPELAGQEIMRIPAFRDNGQFSPALYQQMLQRVNQTPSEFLSQIQTEIAKKQVQFGLVVSSFALPYEVRNNIALTNQRRDIDYLLIPKSLFKPRALQTTEEKTYYQNNLSNYQTPERVSLEYIQLPLDNFLKTQKVSDQDVKNYYEENIKQYKVPEQKLVAHILIKDSKKIDEVEKRVRKGENFAKLAKAYSQDLLSAKQGGVLPWMSSGVLDDPAFDKAVANLKKPDEVSDPVKTKYGIHIIKLLSVKPAQQIPLENVREKIHTLLLEQQAQHAFINASEELTNLSYMNPDSLSAAAQAFNLPIQTTPLFTREGLATGVAANAKIIQAAFSDSVLKNGNNSDVIQLDPKTILVLRIKEHEKPQPKPFVTVQSEIKQILLTREQEAEAEKLGQLILREMQSSKESALLQKNNLKWFAANQLTRTSIEPNAQIVGAAFRLPKPNDKGIPSVVGFRLPNGDYAVVKLMRVSLAKSAQLSDPQQRVTTETMANQFGQEDYDFYVRELVKKASVVKYDKT